MNFDLTKEQKDIVKAARKFAQGEFPERALEFDREEKFDLELWRKACEFGFVGVFIDEAYSGAGMGFFEHALITEEFWAADPGIGQAIISATFGSELIQLYGTEAQKQAILPNLVSGKAMIGTAITEPGAGSDPAGAVTRAVKDGSDWVINGNKMFTTNGTIAQHIIAFCLTNPDASSRHERHSFILIPTNSPGYTAEKIKGKMGIRASDTAEVALRNVRVPLDHLIGEENKGFHQLMNFFNHTRIHICAQGVGLAKAALDESIRYAKERKQFGKTLSEFQVIQFKIAEMATLIRAARNLYYEAAWGVDKGKPDHALIAMAKWYSAETAIRCADEGVQIHGGYGYIDESKVNRLYRAAKILDIYEGTREMEKMIIGRSYLS